MAAAARTRLGLVTDRNLLFRTAQAVAGPGRSDKAKSQSKIRLEGRFSRWGTAEAPPGESSPWRRCQSALKGPILASGKQTPDLQAARLVLLWAPRLVLQPAVLSWAAGGPRAELSSHSP